MEVSQKGFQKHIRAHKHHELQPPIWDTCSYSKSQTEARVYGASSALPTPC